MRVIVGGRKEERKERVQNGGGPRDLTRTDFNILAEFDRGLLNLCNIGEEVKQIQDSEFHTQQTFVIAENLCRTTHFNTQPPLMDSVLAVCWLLNVPPTC